MKKFIVLIFVLSGLGSFAQEKVLKKPEYVIVAGGKIITKEKLEELAKQGLIKGINKGVTEEERKKLAEEFGDKIGDRGFVVSVDLLTEKEKTERQDRTAADNGGTPKVKNLEDDLKLKVNDVASGFTVEMINGKKINLADLKGKVVLLNYWATWCAPCLIEFAEFPEKILEPFKDKNFVLLAISIGESRATVEEKMDKMKKYGVNFNVGLDPTKEIWDKYAVGAIPKSFLIDKNGTIKYVSIGNAEGNVDKLSAEIERLLAE